MKKTFTLGVRRIIIHEVQLLPFPNSPLAAKSISVNKNLSLDTPSDAPNETLRGIKEKALLWPERPRELFLTDSTGMPQAEVRIPDRNLTPRVVALLGAILDEIESHQRGGGPIRLEP